MKKSFLEFKPVKYARSAVNVMHFRGSPHKTCSPLHWHESIELLYIKKGRMYVSLGTDLVEANSGELVIITPKVFHTGYTREEAVEYSVLMFDLRLFYNKTELCKNLLPAIFEGKAIFCPVTAHKETVDCVNSICNDKDHETLNTAANVYRLLSLLYQHALSEFRAQPMNADVKRISDYLEENASQELSIALLCERFGYTPAHLCRKFKKVTGLSPMNYLKIYRLELAQDKLRNSTASINSIAAECGFLDSNYFTRCFRQHFGVAPLAYRKAQARFPWMESSLSSQT